MKQESVSEVLDHLKPGDSMIYVSKGVGEPPAREHLDSPPLPDPPPPSGLDGVYRGFNEAMWGAFKWVLVWIAAPTILFGIGGPIPAAAWLGGAIFLAYRRSKRGGGGK